VQQRREQMTTYGKSSAGEFYAEAFTAWEMRDVADPPPIVGLVAETVGWVGA
jgi:hypothetical protein